MPVAHRGLLGNTSTEELVSGPLSKGESPFACWDTFSSRGAATRGLPLTRVALGVVYAPLRAFVPAAHPVCYAKQVNLWLALLLVGAFIGNQ